MILSELWSVAQDITRDPLSRCILGFLLVSGSSIGGLLQFWKWQDRKRYRAWLRMMN